MSPRSFLGLLLLFGFGGVRAQDITGLDPEERRAHVPPNEVRLPNGKLQQDEILKLEHEKSLNDVRQLVLLSQSLQKELEQSGALVLNLSSIHKTEEIERIAKRIRSRIRR